MKNHRTLAVAAVAAALALSGSATAQMRGPGGGQGMGPGMGQGATPSDMGRGPGGGAQIHVAPDGKAVYVKRSVTTSGSSTMVSEQVVAVGTAGTVAWTWTPPAMIHDVAFPTGFVAVTVTTPTPHSSSSTTAPTSQVIGLDLASGAQAWATTFDGMVNDLQVTPSGLLAVVSGITSAGTSMTLSHSLVAINLSGKIAWTFLLD